MTGQRHCVFSSMQKIDQLKKTSLERKAFSTPKSKAATTLGVIPILEARLRAYEEWLEETENLSKKS